MISDSVRFRLPAAARPLAAILLLPIVVSGCSTQTAGSLPAHSAPGVASQHAPMSPDKSTQATPESRPQSGSASSAAGGGFNPGIDRVDSAQRVSPQRRAVVYSTVQQYVNTLPGTSLVSVDVADEAPKRSGAHVVVAQDGVRVNLGMTVAHAPEGSPKSKAPSVWQVTDVVRIDLSTDRAAR